MPLEPILPVFTHFPILASKMTFFGRPVIIIKDQNPRVQAFVNNENKFALYKDLV